MVNGCCYGGPVILFRDNTISGGGGEKGEPRKLRFVKLLHLATTFLHTGGTVQVLYMNARHPGIPVAIHAILNAARLAHIGVPKLALLL